MKKILLSQVGLLKKKMNHLGFAFLMLLLGVLNSQQTFAQVASYTYSGTTAGTTYTSLVPATTTGTGIFGTNNWDNSVANIPIGFTFNFNGANYTNVNVSSNGFVTFGATAPSTTNYDPISSTESYKGAIAAYGANLWSNGVSLDCKYTLTGTAPNRYLTIEYLSTKRKNSAGTTQAGTWSFRINLYETTNVIEIVYRTPQIPFAASNITGQIGLRGASNVDYKNRLWAPSTLPNNWPTASPIHNAGTSNTDAVLTRNNSTLTLTTQMTWTPTACFAPPTVTVPVATIGATTATANWTTPSPSPTVYGYNYYVTTSSTLPTVGTTPTGTTTVGATTQSLTGLTPNSLHYLYIRSKCNDGTLGDWSPVVTFTTLCNPAPDPLLGTPYSQNFDATTVPAIPACNSMQNLSINTLTWRTAAPTIPNWSFTTTHLRSAPDMDNSDQYYFTQGVTLTAGQSYRLSYKYGGEGTAASSYLQNLTVYYGTAPNNASVILPALADHQFFKGSPYYNVVNFIPSTSGVYYFGFHDNTEFGNGNMLLDDIEVDITRCLQPTALLSGLVTSSSSVITWTAPTPAAANGYNYYINTTGVAPNAATIPTGTVGAGVTIANLSGLVPNTIYYYWIRSNCGGGDYSYWSTSGTFTTAPLPATTYCTPVQTGTPDPNGITNVTMGTINNTTGLEPGGYGNYSSLTTTVARGTVIPVNITYQTGFSYDTTIWVDWNNDSDFADPGENVYIGNSTSAVPTTLMASFTVPIGATLGAHRLRIGGQDIGPLTDPCRTGTWQVFEDYTIFVIPAPPALILNGTSITTCAGVPTTPLTTITTGLSSYNVFVWSPSGTVTGTSAAGYSFAPIATTEYTLTALNNSTFETNTVKFMVNVNQPPTPIVITPNAATICQGQTPVTLVATGGALDGTIVYSENFNAVGLPIGWTKTNTTTGSNPTSADWTVHIDGAPIGLGEPIIHSNDNSQYISTTSDDPGIGTTTDVELISNTIDLSPTNPSAIGLVSCKLTFWHYFLRTNDIAQVLISTDDGVTFPTVLRTFNSAQGTSTNFKQAGGSFDLPIIDLTPYIGQNKVKIKFKYHALWGWHWAIDNVMISGSATTSISWAPTTGLYTSYTSSTINTPYTGTARTTVLALPNTTTTYTASASSGVGCQTTTTVDVTVIPLVAGTIPGGNQYICDNTTPIALTLTGYVGTIVEWQWSLSPTFASGINTIANTSATLTAAMMGTLTTTTYFRAVITASGCVNKYSNIVAIYVPVSTWNGSAWIPADPDISTKAVFEGNYTSAGGGAGDFEACSVQVNSGNVIFTSGDTMTVENGVTVTGGSLTFNNDANLIQNNNASVNSGSITYKINTTGMKLWDYTYWSSPVSGMSLYDLSPNTLFDKYFIWNTSLSSYYWTSVPSSTIMQAAMGYIIRAPQNFSYSSNTVFNGVFVGVPFNGVKTITLHKAGVEDWNLVGNPYPSDIYANLLIGINATYPNFNKIDGTIYFWTHNTPASLSGATYTANDYAYYNMTGGVGTNAPNGGVNNTAPNGFIASGQSFFVKSLVDNQPLTFNNEQRYASNNGTFYRTNNANTPNPSQLEKNRVWLQISNNVGAYCQSLLGYVEGATSAKDRNFDTDLYDTVSPTVCLYSTLGADKLGIKGVGLPFDVNDTHNLGYSSKIAENYEISLADFDGLFDSQDIYLEDTLLGIVHNLKTSNYAFHTEIGTFDSRFVLRFTDATLGTNNADIHDNKLVVYKKLDEVFINAFNIDMKSVSIIDVSGRVIYKNNSLNNSKQLIVRNLNSSNQVLIVQITTKDGVITNKKIVF